MIGRPYTVMFGHFKPCQHHSDLMSAALLWKARQSRWWNLLSTGKAHLWCGERLWELAAYQDGVRGTSGCCRKYFQVITSVHYCFTLEQSPDTKSAISIFTSHPFLNDSLLRFSKKFCESPELTHVGFDCRGFSCIYENFIRSSYTDLHCNARIWINAIVWC